MHTSGTAAAISATFILATLHGSLWPVQTSDSLPRPPIIIDGNSNFTSANGITNGTGTLQDPFIIEGWEIDATTGNGIDIRNTDAYFVVRENFIHSGGPVRDGIFLYNVIHAIISNNVLTANAHGLSLYAGIDVAIQNNTIDTEYSEGIEISSSTNVTAVKNIVRGGGGILLSEVTSAMIKSNNIRSESEGISVELSSSTTLVGNTIVSSDGTGIAIFYSVNVTLSSNSLLSGGVAMDGWQPAHFDSHVIGVDNLVNGRPLLYLNVCSDVAVDGAVFGQLLVASCSDVHVSNLTLSEAGEGIFMAYVDNVTVRDSAVRSSVVGIHLLWLSNATLSNVTTEMNQRDGVHLEAARNVTVINSVMVVNGWTGLVIGGRGAVGSSWITVSDSSFFANGLQGVRVGGSNVTLSGNGISANRVGVNVGDEDNVTLWGNDISANLLSGADVSLFSRSVRIFGNTFADNPTQATDASGPENAWDDGYPSGGNFWSDYAGIDNCSGANQDVCPDPDGMGDTPRVLDPNSRDRYPLMSSPVDYVPPLAPALLSAEIVGGGLADLRLTWNRSADEGVGGGTVAYRIARSPALYGPFVPVAMLPANGSSTYDYVCGGCGFNLMDTNTFLYRIDAVDSSSNTQGSNLAARYVKGVQAGSNLLGLPVDPVDRAVPTVLQTLDVDVVRTYRNADASDPWKAWYASRQADLTELSAGEAFWANVTVDGLYVVAGLIVESPAILLNPGWNLVAYVSFVPETWDASLAGVSGLMSVERAEPGTPDPYGLRLVAGGDMLSPGEAYWIRVSSSAIWVQG